MTEPNPWASGPPGYPQQGGYPPPPGYGPPPGGYGPPPGFPPGAYGPRGPKPSNHLALAIVSTVCVGCLPLGIVAIVFASQVDGKWNQGDTRGAMQASEKARRWAIWSIIIGVVLTVLYFVAIIASGGLASESTY